jgi:hypothetical protein
VFKVLAHVPAFRHVKQPIRFLSWPWAAALCGIAVLLVAIGALQYRWNAQIRQATEVRMGADLESASIFFPS